MMLAIQHPGKYVFMLKNSSASSNPILVSIYVCLAHKFCKVLYLFSIILTNDHIPFSCSPKLFNYYSQNIELVLILLFTLQFCYASNFGVMFEFHSCSPEISHVIFLYDLVMVIEDFVFRENISPQF